MYRLGNVDDHIQFLVIELCRRTAAFSLDGARLGCLTPAADRRRFLDFARRQGVLGLVLAALGRPHVGMMLSPEARSEFAQLLAGLRRRAGLWLVERDRVLSVLRRDELDPIMLKGGGLCTTLYDEPVQRGFGDLDILLPRDQLERGVSTLLEAGYENPWNEAQLGGYMAHHFHVRLTHPRGFIVEVHFGLTAPGSAMRLVAEEFLAHAEWQTDSGRQALRLPCPEHQLLHVVSQNTQGGFDRLIRFVDIDRIIKAHPRFRWDLLEDSARRGGLLNGLALSLQLARSILSTEVPDQVFQRIRPDFLTCFHLAILRPEQSLLAQRFRERVAAGRLLALWMQPSGRERARYLRQLVTGSDDPLRWIWEQTGAPVRRPSRLSALIELAKLGAYQGGLYLNGLATFATDRSRAAWRF
jgi:Uncharacterised nucleotidyltransferase